MFDFFPVCYVLPHRDTLGVTILDRNYAYDADIAENARLLSLPGIDACIWACDYNRRRHHSTALNDE